jgi:uncharacterized protein
MTISLDGFGHRFSNRISGVIAMRAETDLLKLLATMKPEMHPGEFVFATVSPANFKEVQDQAWGWFREPEGITLILEKSAAIAAHLDFAFPARLITLTVHSSLEAVGFLAVITEKLAAAGISVNTISAYYHDHLFIPVDKAGLAMEILHQIMTEDNGKR